MTTSSIIPKNMQYSFNVSPNIQSFEEAMINTLSINDVLFLLKNSIKTTVFRQKNNVHKLMV